MEKTLVVHSFAALELEHVYDYFLAITPDSLYVMGRQKEIVEPIIIGSDNKGYLVSADNEDAFLNAISIVKRAIQAGLDPVKEILGC